jgi:cytoskeletal protein CcmA (bactofilin family)
MESDAMSRNEVRNNLVISGSGSASGGIFHAVKINGEGTITGDIDCTDYKTNGSSRIVGNVKAQEIKVNGHSEIEGSVEADVVIINGQTDIGGNLSVKKLKLQGKTDIGGSLAGDQLELGGVIQIHSDCEAELFALKGSFNIGGLLNAGTIDIHLYGPCHVREIGGEAINVKLSGWIHSLHKIIQSLFPGLEKRLTADTIEGDDIYLEYTTANVVRGNRIRIGQGCEIDRVEYKDEFRREKDGKVLEYIQI